MSEKILVPALGESITEASIARWIKNKGEPVSADEPIVELETDKVNLEVPSPVNGVISEINFKDGDTVEVGSVLGTISKKNDTDEQKEEVVKVQKITPKEIKTENIDNNKIKIEKKAEKIQEEIIINSETSIQPDDEKILVLSEEIAREKNGKSNHFSPAVRKIIDEKKIDTDKIQGTGKDGRILKGDLLGAMGINPKINERKEKYGPEERIQMTKLRQTIAKRLKEAQENAAILTTFNEVDMSNIISLRKENQEEFKNRYGIKLGFMSFFVKASVVALKLFPAINAEIDGQDIVYKNYYNISFAVGTEKGLVVPVLRNADELSFAEIEKDIKNLSDKANSNKIGINDLQGGTFTISNGGVYGSMLSTPIINPPQSAILGMHNIVERPVVFDGQIKVRPIMYLALSYDHRIVDGKDSVSFLRTIKESLEEPSRLLLDI
tara:strand:+ start:810 stop:2123 length:1314 start_codon:yes stop_codon:yes gene_type:complete